MKNEPSATVLISQLRNGDEEAARLLWDRFFAQLITLTRSRLQTSSRAMSDEEDIVLSAAVQDVSDPDTITELKGFAGSPGIVEGKARVCRSAMDIRDLQEGEILVAPTTSPSWAPAFAKIKACVTDVGGVMSHAAIVCREYGLPAIVGTGHATKIIKTGMMIRVDGSSGVISITR